jgi:hypothetical protein
MGAAGKTKIALDLLQKAIKEVGEKLPTGSPFTSEICAVPMATWRTHCYTSSIDDAQAAKQKAFVRASEKLLMLKLITVWNGWVWLC